jgi:hypothetical protein
VGGQDPVYSVCAKIWTGDEGLAAKDEGYDDHHNCCAS